MEGRWKDSQEMDFGGKRRKTGDSWTVQVFAIRSDGGQGPCFWWYIWWSAWSVECTTTGLLPMWLKPTWGGQAARSTVAWTVNRNHLLWPSHPGVPSVLFFFFVTVSVKLPNKENSWDNFRSLRQSFVTQIFKSPLLRWGGAGAHTRVLADTLVLTCWSPEVWAHFPHLHRISEHFTFRTNSNYLSNSRWSPVPPWIIIMLLIVI